MKYILQANDLKNLCETCIYVEERGLKVSHFLIDSDLDNISMILEPVVIAKVEDKDES
jgi:hypothetical protein